MEKIKEGSRVLVAGGFGTETPRIGIIDYVDLEGKNGETVVDYYEEGTDPNNLRWAYLYQILEVY